MNNKIKIIDLLNKIANGDIPKKIKYKDLEYRACGNGISGFIDYVNDDNRYCFSACIGVKTLNDEVEILEEEKKIPEKFKVHSIGDKDENGYFVSSAFPTDEEFMNKINDIIDYLDYLKSKGE